MWRKFQAQDIPSRYYNEKYSGATNRMGSTNVSKNAQSKNGTNYCYKQISQTGWDEK